MDRQLKATGPKLLDGVTRQLNPVHGEIFQKHPVSYYWSTYPSEGRSTSCSEPILPELRIEGRREAFQELLALLDPFDPWFNVVTP